MARFFFSPSDCSPISGDRASLSIITPVVCYTRYPSSLDLYLPPSPQLVIWKWDEFEWKLIGNHRERFSFQLSRLLFSCCLKISLVRRAVIHQTSVQGRRLEGRRIIVATIDEICPRDNCSAAETRRRDLIEILPFVERRLRFS